MPVTAPAPTRASGCAAQLQPAKQIDHDFVAEHLERIFIQIHRRVRNVDDAQDLTQEVFIKALRCGSQLRDPQKASHWISRIAANAAIDFLRRRRDTVAFGGAILATWHVQDNPEQLVTNTQHRGILKQALKSLSDRERTAIMLRNVHELPAGEVARIMGCSQATVRSHIANARIKLRRVLSGEQNAPCDPPLHSQDIPAQGL